MHNGWKTLAFGLAAGLAAAGAGCGGDDAGASGGVVGAAPSTGATVPAPGVPGVPPAAAAPGAVPGVPPAAVPGVPPAAVPGEPPAAVPGEPPAAVPGVPPAAGSGAPPAAGGGAAPVCRNTPPPAIKLTSISAGLVGPTHMAMAPGDPTRMYVTEQRGTVVMIENGVLNPTPLLDLRSFPQGPVNSASIIPGGYSEGGLLAIAFDPEFETTKRLWLSYTTPGPGYSLAEFTMQSPGVIDSSSYKQLVDLPQFPFAAGQATNHVGSMVAFSPVDGYMYISRGDGGGENDRQRSGQDNSDDLCSILRIDPDTYPTPVPGNLQGHVWNYGFRNPWRFSFDRATGDMYIGDVGQDQRSGFEEINIEPAGVSGRNYGWGTATTSPLDRPFQGPCTAGCNGTTGPALAYTITPTANSVIGGYVYRGTRMPDMVGRYIWADWSERQIKTLTYAGEQSGQPQICDEYDTGVMTDDKVRSFAEDLDGEIYVLIGGTARNGAGIDTSGAGVTVPGELYRIDPQ